MSAMKSFKEEIIEQIAEDLMVANGWSLEGKAEFPLEWDASRNDSQYSMMKEYAEFVVDKTLQYISQIETPEDYEEEVEELPHEHEESIFDEYGHLRRTQTNTTSAALYIFMDAGTGNPRYVKDVRQWLAKVDSARIPDDTEIEGTLHLAYDVDLENVERIECLECGEKDLLLTTHKCSTHA